MGGTGPRLVGGDFNVDAHGLPVFALWRQLGWIPAQELAAQLWQQEMKFTSKHATERDIIWLSPEAVALCRLVDVADVFAEHATITVGLHIPTSCPPSLTWTRPSHIPWSDVDSGWQTAALTPQWTSEGDANQLWAEWAASFEDSLDGFVKHQPARKLLNSQKGRLSRTGPTKRLPSARVLRPSRPSEVQLRNDLIGSEVKLWFRQLRRLQSYVAAIKANKQTCEAVAYRLELWSAILRSPGFLDGFSLWWQLHRLISLPDTPGCLPSAPPTATLAAAIFAAFKCNFEELESWHLRQRSKLLQLKYEKGMQGIFQDLKAPTRDKLDLRVDRHHFAVLAVDEVENQLHLDAEILTGGFSKWTYEDQEIHPQQINEVVLHLADASSFTHGDVLVQHRTFSDTHDLHRELLDYWRPTWCALATIQPDTWKRVMDFFKAHVPQFHFGLAPITETQWRRALRRYKSTAARGVDGLSHVDLLALPSSWTLRFLSFLNAIEQGEMEWPVAVLYGVVSVLAKDPGAQTVSRFRPIVIFSIIYRTWASLRSKQLLRLLAPHMDVEAYGFMPGCEPSQLWLVLQAEIECALQSGEAKSGLSTDLTRAFNFIPRQHTFALALHLGVPLQIVHPWRSFLASCTRAFEVRGTLSLSTTSTCGLPEGDALSVFGMTQLCFAWHLYMRAYCPAIRSLSFVDNLGLVAAIPSLLVQGLICLREFFRLWNLQLDSAKSYCWALHDADRRQLAVIPFQRVEHAHELGGVLSFTRRRFTGLQQKRISSLSVKWKRLMSSRAPLRQKLQVLPSVFWSSALYGINGSCLGEHHIDDLRKQAVRALRLNGAGSNSLLRLSLCGTPCADPGFWRLRMTVRALQRLLRKEPRLFGLWKVFMQGYEGCLFSGPFSQLLTVLNQIDWRIEPPFLWDHDGCCFNLCNGDLNLLDELLYDAWLQQVARKVTSRVTMRDLSGLDPLLLAHDSGRMDSLQASLVSALRSAAFIDRAAHARYDLSKSADCTWCGVPDTNLHWLECPRFAAVRASLERWQEHHAGDSTALRAHLLPSRSPFAGPWKHALMAVPDTTRLFLSEPSTGIQHVFTDGSATSGQRPFRIAAWGALNATTGNLLAMGHVTGLSQTSDRAELMAVVGALEWQTSFEVAMHLWTDSKFVADGLLFILQHGAAGAWSHGDLWERIEHLLHENGQNELVPHWVPSHLDEMKLTCAFEDWVKLWNDRIDMAVGRHNLLRSDGFFQLRNDALRHFDLGAERMGQLRSFYSAVAAQPAETNSEAPERLDVSLFGFVPEPQISVGDLYIPSTEDLVGATTRPRDMPVEFVESLIKFLVDRVATDSGVYPLCFEELALWLIKDFQFQFPFAGLASGEMEMHPLSSRFERPTFGYLYRHVRRAVQWFFGHGDLKDVCFSAWHKVDLRIQRPTDGIFIRLSGHDVQRCQRLLGEFTSNRPIRKSNDLARPA